MIKHFVSLCFILALYYDFTIMLGIFQQEHYNTKKYLIHIHKYYTSSVSTLIMLIAVIPVILFDYSELWYYGVMVLFLILGFMNFTKPLLVKLKFTKRILRIFIVFSLLLLSQLLIFHGRSLIYNIFIILVPLVIILVNYILLPIEKVIRKIYLKKALTKLEKINPLVIAVTGSYGKTSVKNFILEIADKAYISVKTPASYNTLMGITKTINDDISPLTEVFITEMGAFRKGEIKELTTFVNPQIAVITEIGPQHLESFKSIDNVQDTKFEIVLSERLEYLVLNIDNEYIQAYEKYLPKERIDRDNIKVIKVSMKDTAADIYMKPLNGNVYQVYKDKRLLTEITINLMGEHNLMNILESIAVGLILKVNISDIVKTIEMLESVPHRMSETIDGAFHIIDDAFNSNIKGFKAALKVLKEKNNFRVIITPGIVDGGLFLKELNSSLTHDLINSCDLIILIKNQASKIIENEFIRESFHKYLMFDSFNEAYAYLKKTYPSTDMTILIENDLPDSFLRR